MTEQDLIKFLSMSNDSDTSFSQLASGPVKEALEIKEKLSDTLDQMQSNVEITRKIEDLNETLDQTKSDSKNLLFWNFIEKLEHDDYETLPGAERQNLSEHTYDVRNLRLIGMAGAIYRLRNESQKWEVINSRVPLASNQDMRIMYASTLKIAGEEFAEKFGLPIGDFKRAFDQYLESAIENWEVPSKTLEADNAADDIRYLLSFVKKYLKVQVVKSKMIKSDRSDIPRPIDIPGPIDEPNDEFASCVVIYLLKEVGKINEFYVTGKAIRGRLRRAAERKKKNGGDSANLKPLNLYLGADTSVEVAYNSTLETIANTNSDPEIEQKSAAEIREKVIRRIENFKRPQE